MNGKVVDYVEILRIGHFSEISTLRNDLSTKRTESSGMTCPRVIVTEQFEQSRNTQYGVNNNENKYQQCQR